MYKELLSEKIVHRTNSHVMDAKYPGLASQIVNLSGCWDRFVLKEKSAEIRRLWDENASYHASAKRYLAGMSSLFLDIWNTAEGALEQERLRNFATGFAKRHLRKEHDSASNHGGGYSVKKLAAITPDGYILHKLPNNYKKILIYDSYFAAANTFLQIMSECAVSHGHTVTASYSNNIQKGRIEHLVIPDARHENGKGIAFITVDPLNQINISDVRRTNLCRFYNNDMLALKRQRIDFSKKAATALKNEAITALQNAKSIHDQLEGHYIGATDFSLVDRITHGILKEIAMNTAINE